MLAAFDEGKPMRLGSVVARMIVVARGRRPVRSSRWWAGDSLGVDRLSARRRARVLTCPIFHRSMRDTARVVRDDCGVLMATRLGVDIGGTFTDLIFYDDRTGEVRVGKTPTTPDGPERGVMKVITDTVSPEEIGRTEFFMHGATIGLNALLERSGAVTGLICTEGFRDTLEIRRADREAMYDLRWRIPEPFVPRRLRLPIRGRLRADGHVLEPLDESAIEAAVATFAQAGVTAIAVAFINAYADPRHELEAERLIRAHGFTGDISLSHRLTREYREYERTSTTVIDAYIRGATSHYLRRLNASLARVGFRGELLIMRSGGGVLGSDDISQRPFEAIQSGPVGGAEGAATLCQSAAWPLAITADVGGTSFDAALIVNGRPHVRHEGRIAGWPVLTPWVDVRSIGAGGGSIAYVDGGMLRVGPRSSGAVPGPACYAHGGTQPTVTDAALLLGMLGDGVFASGLRLERPLADVAFKTLGEQLNLSVQDLARGVMQIATAAMGNTMREITIGQGEDPRRARLIAFGGAGPLFATSLALELGIRDVVIPRHAGNFSAWGLTGQDRTYEASRTLIRPWSKAAMAQVAQALTDMFDELEADHPAENGRERERTATFDLRYAGQDHTIPVRHAYHATGLPSTSVETVANKFTADYQRRFGVTLEQEMELVTIRSTVRDLLPRIVGEVNRAQLSGEEAKIRAFSFREETWEQFRVVDRASVSAEELVGPLIIKEHTATTYVDTGFSVKVGDASEILLTDTAAKEH